MKETPTLCAEPTDEVLAFAFLKCPEWRERMGLPPEEEGLSQEQLAAVLGISKARVQQIERAAFRKIEQALEQLLPNTNDHEEK